MPNPLDYNFVSYCSTCRIILPIVNIRCINCKRKVRHTPTNKRTYYNINKRPLYKLPYLVTIRDSSI